MRLMGHNVLAIAAATLAIYLIEFVIFAVMIPEPQYKELTGLVEGVAGQGDDARMPFGIIMPLLTAIGLALVIKWRNAAGWMEGLRTGLMMAVLFGFSTSLYGYVYGAHTADYLPINLAHFLVCWGAAGAVLGAWK
jgi:Protein of unknown function (DUF1761)